MKRGFTLIELLVTLAIISLVVTIAAFALREAQKSGRDGRRKADLENISIGVELYRSDCGVYPNSVPFRAALAGSGSGNCNGTYISSVPDDPQYSARNYSYARTTSGFMLCASLEAPPSTPVDVSGCPGCGGSGCNWKVTHP